MTLILLAVGWLVGMAPVALWGAPGWFGAAVIGAAGPGMAAWRGKGAALLVVGMAGFALAGGVRLSTWEPAPQEGIAELFGRTVTLRGSVVSEPAPGETTTSYTVAANGVRSGDGWQPARGRVRVTAGQYSELLPGTSIEVRGKLEEPPVFPEFDYRQYLSRQGVVATMYRPSVTVVKGPPAGSSAAAATRMRLGLDAALQRALPEPAASLAGGIAFGRDAGISDELYEAFRASGLAHIVAVSGANVSMIAALAFLVFVPVVGRRIAIYPAGALLAVYVVAAGGSASVVRAAIMAGVFLVGEWIGRPQAGLPALGLAIVAMTAYQPGAALDAGFQLSVAATAGLIVFSPWIRWGFERYLRRGAGLIVPGMLYDAAAVTLAATVATLPMLWVHFGRVSLVSPLANVLVAPALLVALPLTVATAVAGMVSSSLGWALGLAAYYPLTFIIGVARAMASVPGAAPLLPGMNGSVELAAVALLCAAGWPAYRYLAPDRPFAAPLTPGLQRVRAGTFAGLAAGALSAVVPLSLGPIGGPGVFEMVALDVGQGDAILLRTPHGRSMLVDGGSSGIVLARELGAVLPHWQRSLDLVMLTHPQEDHVGGLPAVLRRFQVGGEWDTGVDQAGNTDEAYVARAKERTTVRAGDAFELDGVHVDVLWPDETADRSDVNATSLILRVRYGETVFLLTGDLEAKEQRALMANEDVRADVLKVPHHGSKTSDPAFLRKVGARVAVISVGAGNSYGHPGQQTLQALSGGTILRTDLDGRVTVRSDGVKLTIATER